MFLLTFPRPIRFLCSVPVFVMPSLAGFLVWPQPNEWSCIQVYGVEAHGARDETPSRLNYSRCAVDASLHSVSKASMDPEDSCKWRT